MAYKIVWTNEADISFEEIVKYLETNFSEREINKFVDAVYEKIHLIETDPRAYRQSVRLPNYHYTNILGKVILVYRVKHEHSLVELLRFWDGRQNPKRFAI